MNKKFVRFILPIVLISIVVSFYYMITANKIKSEDTQLINNVVEIEKNLVLAQTHSISFNDFKNKVSSFFHSNYGGSYLDKLEQLNNNGNAIAITTKTPLYQDISKVYQSKDEEQKYIYVKIPENDVIGEAVKLYVFQRENNEWKIRVIKDYVLSNEKDIEIFTNYNGILIEYKSIKILE